MGRVALALVYGEENRYSVYALAAAVESRCSDCCDVFLVNYDRDPLLYTRVARIASEYEKTIVGVSFCTPQLPVVQAIVRELRRLKNILLVAGGPHPTADPVGTIFKLGFDAVVYGEGEDTLVSLVRSYHETGEFRVCGIAYPEGGRVVVLKRESRVDLDSYPPFPYWRGLYCPIEVMRGCGSFCGFCQVPFLHGRPRYRSVESTVEHAEVALKLGMTDLRFIAPNSLGYGSPDGIKPCPECLESLLSSLRAVADRYGRRLFYGSFPSEVRPDSVTDETARILRRYVHNKRVVVGGQSGSERVLRMLGRGHGVEDIVEASMTLLSHGFMVDVDFILGLPGETEEDMEETVRLMEVLASRGVRVRVHRFMPLPGTPLELKPLSPIAGSVKKRVLRLVGAGRAFGEWEKHEAIAEMIVELTRARVIVPPRDRYLLMDVRRCRD